MKWPGCFTPDGLEHSPRRWRAMPIVLLFAFLIAGSLSAQTTQPRTGSFQIPFTDPSPHSAIETQNRRHRIKVDDTQRYSLAEESFEVVVPDNYDGERPFGALVWVSPTPSGRLPEMWKQTLETHNLIWIGANNSGNERGVGVRFGLALDAAHNIKRLYKIDDSRVYVAGFSGGGKVASMLGMIYPEVFQGTIPMGGVGFYRTIPVPQKKGMVYPNTFDKPPKKMFEVARTQRRFVLLIGDQDFNFEPVSTTYQEGFKTDEFAYASLLVVPGLEHTLADETWLEKAIMLLDSPLADQARDLFAKAVELEKQQKFAEAYKLYLQVSMHGGESLGVKVDDRIAAIFEHARLEMVKARRAADAKQYADAAAILIKLRETYGEALPPEVQQLLAELRANPDSAAGIKAVEDRATAREREAVAAAALETAQAMADQDVRRGYEALRKVASDYPNTPAARAATTEADRLLSDPKIKAEIETDPAEVEARKQLNLAENYRRNKLYAQARQRLESLIKTYPNTKAAAEAKRLLEQVKTEEAAR